MRGQTQNQGGVRGANRAPLTLWLINCVVLLALLGATAAACAGGKEYALRYTITLNPSAKSASVRIEMDNSELVSQVDFNIAGSQCSQFFSDNEMLKSGGRLLWFPKGEKATLAYQCRIKQARPSSNGDKTYDAYINRQWAVFRGDDLVPPAKVRAKKGAHSKASVLFELPDSWPTVHTGWPRLKAIKQTEPDKYLRSFAIDNPQRKFDRPTGWIIAGQLGTRNAYIGDIPALADELWISAPEGTNARRMDTLAFVQLLWPHLKSAFGRAPKKLLIAAAGKPMWRGGLSAGNSLFLHADRPLISENGTSTLVHELVHVFTGLTGKKYDDWIVEGIAEYYSYTLLQRAGAYNSLRVGRIEQHLAGRAGRAKNLRNGESKGVKTAAAALLFRDLNNELIEKTQSKQSLDDLVQLLMEKKKVSLTDARQAFEQLVGSESRVLQSPLLKEADEVKVK